MAEDIFLPGKFTDLTNPHQLAELNDLLYEMLGRLNQIDPNSIALSWLQGDVAGQVIASKGVGNSPEWDATPQVTGAKVTGLAASQLVVTDGSKNLTSQAPTGAYTTSNVSEDRSFNADSVLIAELADVVGTLIADLKAQKIIG